jgi:hypothetical protein
MSLEAHTRPAPACPQTAPLPPCPIGFLPAPGRSLAPFLPGALPTPDAPTSLPACLPRPGPAPPLPLALYGSPLQNSLLCSWVSGGGWWAVACSACILAERLSSFLQGARLAPPRLTTVLDLVALVPAGIMGGRCAGPRAAACFPGRGLSVGGEGA